MDGEFLAEHTINEHSKIVANKDKYEPEDSDKSIPMIRFQTYWRRDDGDWQEGRKGWSVSEAQLPNWAAALGVAVDALSGGGEEVVEEETSDVPF